MYGYDLAIAIIMLFIPAFLDSLRDAGIGNLRVTRRKDREP